MRQVLLSNQKIQFELLNRILKSVEAIEIFAQYLFYYQSYVFCNNTKWPTDEKQHFGIHVDITFNLILYNYN